MSARSHAISWFLIFATTAFAATPQPVTVPAGTHIHFKLKRTISSATAKAGEHVPAELTQPVVVDGRTIANAGAPAQVRVGTAEASGRIGGSAKLTFSLPAS